MRLVTLVLLLAALPAAGQPLADVQVYDRTAGRYLDIVEHDGRRYVAGAPGHEFRVDVRSRHGARLLAVASVDGVNVVSGETADTDQAGYVLAPWQALALDGWRKSLQDVASFYFTEHRNSYAARTGRPADVGVIGVAVFRERSAPRCCWPWRGDAAGQAKEGAAEDRAEGPPAAAAAPELQSRRRDSQLGTGHGRRLDAPVTPTVFERASDSPDEVIAIYYDSHANLVARGVLPRAPHVARHRPRPFPGAFVPDP